MPSVCADLGELLRGAGCALLLALRELRAREGQLREEVRHLLVQRRDLLLHRHHARLQPTQKLKATLADPTIRRFLIHNFEL